jgi:hypothetical protein
MGTFCPNATAHSQVAFVCLFKASKDKTSGAALRPHLSSAGSVAMMYGSPGSRGPHRPWERPPGQPGSTPPPGEAEMHHNQKYLLKLITSEMATRRSS